MTLRTTGHLIRLARAHLSESLADDWLGLLRPAVQLRAARAGETVVARLGGVPNLPDDVQWPEWEGHGALGFVAEVDLAALSRSALDPGLALPADGRLLAFYFDDPEGVGTIVHFEDPESRPGSRLLHVVDGAHTSAPAVELAGVQVLTWPDWEHPILEQLGLDELPDEFTDALGDLLEDEVGPDVMGQQIGGWAQPVQGPVEYEAAVTGEATYDDAHTAEALNWRPLLQIDSDEAAGTSWGDAGCLYWLARTDGTSAPRESDIAFTWQCG